MPISPPVVFVVGLQKSGTTLMTRLLNRTGLVSSPWNGEGHDFWGNVPPFSPREHPAGTVYQRHNGDLGHEISADDAGPEVRALLSRRLRELPDVATPLIVNKNPYNTVRLPWIRALFPEARIVAMVRRPVPNVFSLLKKHSLADEIVIGPEEGWWGVKPAGWRNHVVDSVVERCAWQWSAVNRKLSDDRGSVDDVIAYHDLCRDPTTFVERILGRDLAEPLAPTRCFDGEFLKGSELLSKNRYSWRTKSLTVPEAEPVEFGPLDSSAVAAIERVCRETEAVFPELT
jgi:Sulfotransferase family